MPSYFFDSSALAKRYHKEPGSSWVHAICDPRTHPPIYIAQLAHVEVVAALRRTGRREGLHHSFIDAMVNIFERHIAASATQHSSIYHITPLLPGIDNLAVHLCNKYWTLDPHPLRSLDAIQLASAIFAAALVQGTLILVASDTRLLAIAQLEGFQVINPLYPSQ